ncbi:MAG TPA: serine/threonine-protein kinase, partial [Gemmatales bacterium]|nr:serine/threonine-protein kinase [Gemmatales bacterium]
MHLASSSSSFAHPPITSDIFDRFRVESPVTWTKSLEQSIEDRARNVEQLPTIPGFTELHEIGRGGMGIVYRARQEGLNRPVAIKMIMAGHFANPTERLRFQLEAELTARIHHPHVVQVYETGEHEGNPYLVMEWIDGGTLASRLKTDRPSPETAVHLMITLARAVHAAHCKGVIHRDLKPNNIMLASMSASSSSFTSPSTDKATHRSNWTSSAGVATWSSWHLKITDFGLAKPMSGDSHITGSQFVVGTPAYMAPEQDMNQPVGTAADIYALGVIFFEMLSGQTPFVDASPMALMLKTINEEPPLLRSKAPGLSRDLEAICSKCLNKSPQERYATAQELAEDLENYLHGKPLKARPLGALPSMLRRARRHRLLSGLLAALVLVTLSALVTITMLYLEAREQRRQAEKDRDLAQKAEQQATQEKDKSIAMLNLLRGLLEVARPANKGIQVTLKEALDTVVEKIDSHFAKEPIVAAHVHDELGMTYFTLEQYQEALKHQTRALALYTQTVGPHHRDTLLVRSNLFSTHLAQGRYQEAEAEYSTLLEEMRQHLGEVDPQVLALLHNYASMQEKRGIFGEAVQAYRQLVTAYEKQSGINDSKTIIVKANLAGALHCKGDHDEANLLMADCLARAREHLGRQDRLTLGLQQNEALRYLHERQFTEAETLLKETLAGYQEVYGPDSLPGLTVLNNLAGAYEGQGKTAEALAIKREVASARARKLGEHHPETLVARYNLLCAELGDRLASKSSIEEPYRSLQELLQLRLEVLGSQHPDTLLNQYSLGYYSNQRDDFTQASHYFREAVQGYLKLFGEKHEMTLLSTIHLGATLAKMQPDTESEKVLRNALASVEKYQPKVHWLHGKVKSLLDQVLTRQHRFEEAEALLLQAYENLHDNTAANPELLDGCLQNLVEHYQTRGLPGEVVRWQARLDEI